VSNGSGCEETHENNASSKSMETITKEGIQVMKQVGKMVEKNVLVVKEQMDSLSKPPPQKKEWKESTPDLFRFGRIIVSRTVCTVLFLFHITIQIR